MYGYQDKFHNCLVKESYMPLLHHLCFIIINILGIHQLHDKMPFYICLMKAGIAQTIHDFICIFLKCCVSIEQSQVQICFNEIGREKY